MDECGNPFPRNVGVMTSTPIAFRTLYRFAFGRKTDSRGQHAFAIAPYGTGSTRQPIALPSKADADPTEATTRWALTSAPGFWVHSARRDDTEDNADGIPRLLYRYAHRVREFLDESVLPSRYSGSEHIVS